MARKILTSFIVTYTYICFSGRSRVPYGTPSMHTECSPTDVLNVHPIASADNLYPIIIHAGFLD